MLAFPIIMITLLWKILSKLDNEEDFLQIKSNKSNKKTHPTIGRVSYKSQLEGRKSVNAYEQYKNANGLYEPVKPNNGIPIKKED